MRPSIGDKFGRLVVLNPFAATKNKQASAEDLRTIRDEYRAKLKALKRERAHA